MDQTDEKQAPYNDDYIGIGAETEPLPEFVLEIIRIRQERNHQIAKWGVQHYDDGKWMWVLMEEVGEVAKELNEMPNGTDRVARLEYLKRLRHELVQCATVCIAWNERISERIRDMDI